VSTICASARGGASRNRASAAAKSLREIKCQTKLKKESVGEERRAYVFFMSKERLGEQANVDFTRSEDRKCSKNPKLNSNQTLISLGLKCVVNQSHYLRRKKNSVVASTLLTARSSNMAKPNTNIWTDKTLIEEIQAGGTRRNRAWEYIYKAWRGYYLKPILKLGGTADQVDEVISQVIIDVDKQIQKEGFVLRISRLRSFFTECLIRAWRKSRPVAVRETVEFNPEVHLSGHTEDAEQQYMAQERHQRLDAMLNQLGEKCKKVLLLFGKGYNMREIASEMNYENEQSAKNAKGECHRKLIELAKKGL